MKLYCLLIFGLLFGLQACAAPSASVTPSTTVSQDPLIGKIVNAKTSGTISFDTLMDGLSGHDIIYLSEKHDNPVQHEIQHRVIQALLDRGAKPVLGFEFFSMNDTPLLLNFVDSKAAHQSPKVEKAVEQQMRKTLGWEDQSDTMWTYYWDLLVTARDNNLWAAGLDLGTSLKRRITRKGMDGITPIEHDMIFSTHLDDPAYRTHMTSIFKDVHCGMGNEQMLTRLYDTWLARNDAMARSLTRISKAARQTGKGPVVVITGNGHTAFGLGVPDRVRAIMPSIRQVNLSMTEVEKEPHMVSAYLAPLELEGHPKSLPADYIWFTPRVSDADPCAKFKHIIEKMKQKKEEEEEEEEQN